MTQGKTQSGYKGIISKCKNFWLKVLRIIFWGVKRLHSDLSLGSIFKSNYSVSYLAGWLWWLK